MKEDELLSAVAALVSKSEQRVHQHLQDINARISVLRYLQEIAYANAFAGMPKDFEKLMTELMRMLRTSPTTTEPIEAEALIEAQTQAATHLQRFSESVSKRIASGRTV